MCILRNEYKFIVNMSTTCEGTIFLHYYYKANTNDDVVFDEFRKKTNETISAGRHS